VSPRLRRFLPVLVAACASLTVFAAPAPAATPCWKLLLNDWYDGTINNVYPIPCYHQAINHLPTDVQVYSSARDDILRALQQAVQAQKTTHKKVTSVQPAPTTTQSTSASTSTQTTAVLPGGATTANSKKGPVSKAIKDITPGGADAFPLPLLILGILAIVLVLAGVGGMLWRRYRGGGGPTGGATGGPSPGPGPTV
jgi:cobalamin biosynthesis Mg chelatase CobN